MQLFETYESEVRSYCRNFPKVFVTAKGSSLTDETGRTYLDFFAGAGALNYGHNPDDMQKALVRYVTSNGVTHSLDMYTGAKREFIQAFQDIVLHPRGMSYKMMFPGPTGTNAVEAAIKLARKVTGRSSVLSFTNAFHGMTLGSLALTGNETKRNGAGVPLNDSPTLPFDGYFGKDIDTIDILDQYLSDPSSGLDKPAAFIVETVQAEGGVNPARFTWLRRLARLAKQHEILLIVDDIQVGCGRTGPFFSFEPAGIQPDLICLSKSLSGYGIPLSIVLIQPQWDQWSPGEHNGTFRGHNLAFVTATQALQRWKTDELSQAVLDKGELVEKALEEIADQYPDEQLKVRGRGLIWGLDFQDSEKAGAVARCCFEAGLIIETAGAQDQVVKVLPALTISPEELANGLNILKSAVARVCATTAEPVGHSLS
ncbi:MAG: diaminobutyrate--2-oxoglutarate transaminase [Acidobacteria bacterium]|nr:diaminobutyrate--2-oxoglutarate transaminase [Acidobacteriota bacterium]MCB9397964.1 diaminobutyrate--2-oxoglutarate transaminase [Acidobacteriota bacterium]